MIVTVTLNPAIDKTACLDTLRPGALNRLRQVRQDIGGKGVNVSRAIATLGGHSVACGFAAGESGRFLLAQLAALGIRQDYLMLPGQTRTNLKLVDDRGSLTELNEPGPAANAAQLEQLTQKLESYAAPGVCFVLAGSANPGTPEDFYARLTARLQGKGAQVLLDADGPLLAAALQGPAMPCLIKPNQAELAGLLVVPPQSVTRAALPAMAGALRQRGVQTVCVSLGGQGAALFALQGAWYAPPLPVAVQSAVGAGDTMLAVLALAMEQVMPWEKAFRLAVAAATAACTTAGTQPPTRPQVENLLAQVQLQPL